MDEQTCDRTQLKSFSIPRKSQDGVLVPVEHRSADEREILNDVHKTALGTNYCKKWEAKSVKVIRNLKLESNFCQKKRELKSEGVRTLQEELAFSVENPGDLDQICLNGPGKRSCRHSLGNPMMGVSLFRHIDVVLRFAKVMDFDPPLKVVVYKVIVGRPKTVSPHSRCLEILEPTPNYDCHVSSIRPTAADKISDAVDRSTIYLYEYNKNAMPKSHPRQCLPYAVVTYHYGKSPVSGVEKKHTQTEIKNKKRSSAKVENNPLSISKTNENKSSLKQSKSHSETRRTNSSSSCSKLEVLKKQFCKLPSRHSSSSDKRNVEDNQKTGGQKCEFPVRGFKALFLQEEFMRRKSELEKKLAEGGLKSELHESARRLLEKFDLIFDCCIKSEGNSQAVDAVSCQTKDETFQTKPSSTNLEYTDISDSESCLNLWLDESPNFVDSYQNPVIQDPLVPPYSVKNYPEQSPESRTSVIDLTIDEDEDSLETKTVKNGDADIAFYPEKVGEGRCSITPFSLRTGKSETKGGLLENKCGSKDSDLELDSDMDIASVEDVFISVKDVGGSGDKVNRLEQIETIRSTNEYSDFRFESRHYERHQNQRMEQNNLIYSSMDSAMDKENLVRHDWINDKCREEISRSTPRHFSNRNLDFDSGVKCNEMDDCKRGDWELKGVKGNNDINTEGIDKDFNKKSENSEVGTKLSPAEALSKLHGLLQKTSNRYIDAKTIVDILRNEKSVPALPVDVTSTTVSTANAEKQHKSDPGLILQEKDPRRSRWEQKPLPICSEKLPEAEMSFPDKEPIQKGIPWENGVMVELNDSHSSGEGTITSSGNPKGRKIRFEDECRSQSVSDGQIDSSSCRPEKRASDFCENFKAPGSKQDRKLRLKERHPKKNKPILKTGAWSHKAVPRDVRCGRPLTCPFYSVVESSLTWKVERMEATSASTDSKKAAVSEDPTVRPKFHGRTLLKGGVEPRNIPLHQISSATLTDPRLNRMGKKDDRFCHQNTAYFPSETGSFISHTSSDSGLADINGLEDGKLTGLKVSLSQQSVSNGQDDVSKKITELISKYNPGSFVAEGQDKTKTARAEDNSTEKPCPPFFYSESQPQSFQREEGVTKQSSATEETVQGKPIEVVHSQPVRSRTDYPRYEEMFECNLSSRKSFRSYEAGSVYSGSYQRLLDQRPSPPSDFNMSNGHCVNEYSNHSQTHSRSGSPDRCCIWHSDFQTMVGECRAENFLCGGSSLSDLHVTVNCADHSARRTTPVFDARERINEIKSAKWALGTICSDQSVDKNSRGTKRPHDNGFGSDYGKRAPEDGPSFYFGPYSAEQSNPWRGHNHVSYQYQARAESEVSGRFQGQTYTRLPDVMECYNI